MKETANAILEQMNFPNQYDVIREEAERFQQLTPDQRFDSIQGLIQMGLELLEISPNKDFDTNAREERELQWQSAYHIRLN
jgi:hypothetical protein